MARLGAAELFERVEEIAAKLRTAGRQDADASTNGSTLRFIDREGSKQQELLDGRAPDHHNQTVRETAFGNQLSYLHNEFNFDVASPLGRVALVTHVSFIPIYPPRYEVEREPGLSTALTYLKPDPVAPALNEQIAELRRKSVHESKGDDPAVMRVRAFVGGKDAIVKKVGRFLSYDQPVITTMRSIERLCAFVSKHFAGSADLRQQDAANRAAAWNAATDSEVASHGQSSRVNMLREHMVLMSDDHLSQLKLTWVRHHSHYQTLTAVEHTDIALAVRRDGLRSENPEATPTLCAIADEIAEEGEKVLVDHTAFDALPKGWADFLFGRYLQGANYLLLPLEWLFDPTHLKHCIHERPSGGPQEDWAELCARVIAACDPEAADASADESRELTPESFRRIWFASRPDPARLRLSSELALRLLRPLISVLFANPSNSRFEFVMFGAAEGAAIILSDVRNFGNANNRTLMSSTIIIDLSMNDFERGRMMKNLTEFSTQRFLSLSTIGSYRFFGDALEVLSEELSNAVGAWLSSERQAERGENGKARAEEIEEAKMKASQDFIATLQKLTIDLTLLSNLINGGISSQTAATEGSMERVKSHIRGIGHYALPGFMSLNDFLDRRFYKSIRSMTQVGNRYTMLRQRAAELSSLVEAKLQIAQSAKQIKQTKDQSDLLGKVDRLTLFGIVYYAGQIVGYATLGGFVLWLFYQGQLEGGIDSASSVSKKVQSAAYVGLLIFAIFIGYGILGELWQEFYHSKLARKTRWLLSRAGLVLIGMLLTLIFL